LQLFHDAGQPRGQFLEYLGNRLVIGDIGHQLAACVRIRVGPGGRGAGWLRGEGVGEFFSDPPRAVADHTLSAKMFVDEIAESILADADKLAGGAVELEEIPTVVEQLDPGSHDGVGINRRYEGVDDVLRPVDVALAIARGEETAAAKAAREAREAEERREFMEQARARLDDEIADAPEVTTTH
jgi:hypothetical protein